MKSRLARFAGLLLVVSASATAAWLVYHKLILPGGALGWDESSHALYGLLIAHDIRQHDWLGLLFDTYRQVYWPPLHSWLAGMVFLVAGPSDVTARVASALCLALLVPLLYLAARRISPQRSEVAGLVAAGLALTSPGALAMAAQCMLEPLGLVTVTATLLIYFQLLAKSAPARHYMLVGVGLLAAYFAKYNCAIVLGLALAGAQIIDGGIRPRNLLTRANFYTALPVCVALGLWFAGPAKVQATWESLVNQPFGAKDTFGPEGLLFYPRAILKLSGSVWMTAVYLACLAASLRFWRDVRVRLLVCLVVIQFVMGEAHHTKGVRHMLPLYPALFILTGHCAAAWWNSARSRGNAVRFWAPRLLLAVLLAHAATLPAALSPPTQGVSNREAVSHIAAVLREPGAGMVLGSWESLDAFCPACLDWVLASREGVLDAPRAGSIAQVPQTRRLADALRRRGGLRWLGRLMLPVLTRYEEPGRARSLYLASSAPVAEGLLAESLRGSQPDRVVLTTPLDLHGTRTALFEPALKRAALYLASTRHFKQDPLGRAGGQTVFQVDIYRR